MYNLNARPFRTFVSDKFKIVTGGSGKCGKTVRTVLPNACRRALMRLSTRWRRNSGLPQGANRVYLSPDYQTVNMIRRLPKMRPCH